MFIGRELASLKGFYDKDGIGMTVIYGRRRIGKSTLAMKLLNITWTRVFGYSRGTCT